MGLSWGEAQAAAKNITLLFPKYLHVKHTNDI